MGVPPSLLSSRWLPKQQRPCLRLLLAWEDLEAALPPLSTRCLQVLLPPQPVGQTTRPITSVPASTTMVMVGCVHRCGKLSGSLLCFTGAPSHPSLYFTLRRLSVWSTVSFPSSRGSVAPVARPAAPAGQCRAASSRSGQPARHVSCEWYKPYLSYEYCFLPVSVTWNKSLCLFLIWFRMCCLCWTSLPTSTAMTLRSPSTLHLTSDLVNTSLLLLLPLSSWLFLYI